MAKQDAGGLSVWRWSGRDRVSLHDLEYLVAANSRHEWRETVLRMRLPDWKKAGTLKDSDPHFAVAAANPGHVFWRDSVRERNGGMKPRSRSCVVRPAVKN